MKKIIVFGILCFFIIFNDQAKACTSFIISGKYTADGKAILFKNRDTGEMKNSLAIFNDGKYKYMGVVNGTEKGWNKAIWGGYNEAGFAIINTAAYNNNIGDTTSLNGHDGILMKMALMVCGSLEDFEYFLDTITKPMGVNSNYGVIDANGGAAYYETGNFKYIKWDANDPEVAPNGILIRTNHSMSADLNQGFGFNRYDNANRILNLALKQKNLSPEFLFKVLPRSLYHPRTDRDLALNLAANKNFPKYEFFVDFIPRISTASTCMIVGAKDREHTEDAMMWTILGFPITSVAIPAWLSSGEVPQALAMDKDYKSPICTAALTFKDECFPIKIDHGENYINIAAVINQEGDGYLQLLQPIEKEIFTKANILINEMENGSKSKKDIKSYYEWVDKYLSETYQDNFNYNLFGK